MYACSSHGKPTTHMSFMFVRQWNKAHHVTANESSHCAISTLHSKRSICAFLRFFQEWVSSGLLSHRLPVALPGFWKTLRSYITSLQNSTIWFQNTFALLSLLHHNDTLWLSSQDLRQNYHQNVSLHNFSKASSATSQQHSPTQFSHTIFTSHCTHATLFPAPCFNILIFWQHFLPHQRLGWTLSNNEPNTLTAVL